MTMIYRKALSFVRRSYMLQMSYKFEFFLRLFFMFFNILTYYFVAKLIGTAGAKYLEPYGGDYFSFVLITLSTLWNFIFASFRVLLYLMIGVLLGVSLAGANVLGALIILGLTIVCFSSIGILSASFIMIFKRGDPINMLFMSTSELFGGVFFPITVLPTWLQTVSHLLPMTYSLNGMRHALLQGYSLRELAPDVGTLVLFSALLLPASLLAFRYAVRKAKMEGTLVHY
ncbi:MAG: ABC-2 type transporter [Methanothrix harundinacea]|uniref:ABC-2 type transporter n=2 Tax=cellular organisms TaxID=131567 RepID=A0A101IFX3_9EURY|nr:MAG: ABC-2 type transporter [Methanothrix harundinacea]